MARKALDNSDDLIRLVDHWRSGKIVVAGDFVLDHQVRGTAERLSPDAPVPVLVAQREEYRPGGAANVALGLRGLRCEVACLGIVGRDPNAGHLREVLKAHGCGVSGLIMTTDRPTPVTHDFVGLAQHRHPQRMFRVDEDGRAPIREATRNRLLSRAAELVPHASVLCLQDHNKGVLTETVCQQLIRLAKRHRVPVLVDPAAIDRYDKYRGATCITPNRFEAALATGRSDAVDDRSAWRDFARRLLRQLRLAAIVVTLDRWGSLLLVNGSKPIHLPTKAREVYDASGAGDIVIATLAATLANGADWIHAMQLANMAAGLAVERFGATPIDLDELLLALLQQRHEDLGKRRHLDQLLPELSAHRKQGKRIAFTNGCFDILHAGHIEFLRKAAQHGDLLVVAVNSDDSIRRIKGRDRPVNRQTDRIMVLSELESIDYLIVFDSDTPMKLIKAIKPDVLVKGGDYQRHEVVGGDYVEGYGGQVALADMVRGKSTTNVIRKIRKNRKAKKGESRK